jgi:hypothetical protein
VRAAASVSLGSDAPPQPATVKKTTLADGRVLLSLRRFADQDAAEKSDVASRLAGFGAQLCRAVASKLAAAARSALTDAAQEGPANASAPAVDTQTTAETPEDRPLHADADRQATHTLLRELLICAASRTFMSELLRPSPVPVAWLPVVYAEPLPVQAFTREGFSLSTGASWSMLQNFPGSRDTTAGIDEAMYNRLMHNAALSLAEWSSLENDVQMFTPRRKARRGFGRVMNMAAAPALQPASTLSEQTGCAAASPAVHSMHACLTLPRARAISSHADTDVCAAGWTSAP